jgi:hypothetical protein
MVLLNSILALLLLCARANGKNTDGPAVAEPSKSSGDTEQVIREKVRTGARQEAAANTGGGENTFCGQRFDDGDILTCDCCASHAHDREVDDHLTRLEEALLLSGGEKKQATVDSDDEVELHTWELGGNVARIGCEFEVPMCYCQDEQTGWSELVPKCTRGKECSPKMIAEKVAHLKEAIEDASRSKAQSSNGDDASGSQEDDGSAEEGASAPACAGANEDNVLFGRQLCEHASVDQCEDLFVRSSGGKMHLCKIRSVPFQCPALFQKKEKVARDTAEVRAWAVQHFHDYDYKATMKQIKAMSMEELHEKDLEIWKKLSLEICSFRQFYNMSIGTNLDCEKNEIQETIQYAGAHIKDGSHTMKITWMLLVPLVAATAVAASLSRE